MLISKMKIKGTKCTSDHQNEIYKIEKIVFLLLKSCNSQNKQLQKAKNIAEGSMFFLKSTDHRKS